MKSICILDYGVGNKGSLFRILESLGCTVKITRNISELCSSSRVILPGVGRHDVAMNNIKSLQLDEAIESIYSSGIPLLGICVGMQLLFDRSEEGHFISPGLGLIPGDVTHLSSSVDSSLRVPHIGWNKVIAPTHHHAFPDELHNRYFYFAHSYMCSPIDSDSIIAITPYGVNICAAVARDNIYGVQFHPEKSHAAGMDFLSNFVFSSI